MRSAGLGCALSVLVFVGCNSNPQDMRAGVATEPTSTTAMGGSVKRGGGKHVGGAEYFTDVDDLKVGVVDEAQMTKMVASMFRAEVGGSGEGSLSRAFADAKGERKDRLRFALSDVLTDADLIKWVDADPTRKARAVALVKAMAPADLGPKENLTVNARIAGFKDWAKYPYQMLIVTGYTPSDRKVGEAGVHPVAKKRLESAVAAYRKNMAPFVLLSGGNVYPRGTAFYEALEMKKEIVAMGVPADVVAVDARARHSTTNLRNAGRFMRGFGLQWGVVFAAGGGVGGSTLFDQAFYFAKADLSTFHERCEKELGYRVGELAGAGTGLVAFTPSLHVTEPSYRDPLDP